MDYIKNEEIINLSKYNVVNFEKIIKQLQNWAEIRNYIENWWKRYLRVSDLWKHWILDNNLRFVDSEVPENLKLSFNDILISRSWSLWLVSIVTEKIIDSILSCHIFKITLDIEKVNPKYLEIYLRSELWQKQFKRKNNWWIIPEINQPALKSIKIILPPLEIQNQIVEKMDFALSEKKRKEKEAKELLESIDDFVLNELWIEYKEIQEKKVFGLNLSDLLDSKRLDPKWYTIKFRTIKEAINKSKYKLEVFSKTILQSIAGERGVDLWKWWDWFLKTKVLRNTNFVNNKNFDYSDVAIREIEEKKLSKWFILLKWDILIEKSWWSEVQPVWRVAIFDLDEKNYSFSNFLHCFRVDKTKVLPNYIFSYLKTIYRLWYMEYIQNQTTWIRNLIMENFLEILIPLPPLEIQEKIANEVKNRIEKAKILEKEGKEEYENLKKEVEEMILG